MTGGIQLIDAFRYSGQRFLDLRQHCATIADLVATPETSIPDGFTKYCDESKCWYEWNSHNDLNPETGRWRKSVPINEVLSEEYIFAIVDADGTFLFGIRHDGEVVYNRGMSDEARARFRELEGIQPMSDENYIYAITDASGRVLFGIDNTGHAVIPRGIVEVTTWEDYIKMAPHPDTLYVIEGKGGRIDGVYINGRALSAGEEYAFSREGDLLMYHGRMSTLPRIWIDYEAMQLMIDYPSGYSGPLFMVEDGMLFLI